MAVRNRGLRCVLIDNLYVIHHKNKSFKNTRSEALTNNNKILYSRWGKFFHQKDCSMTDDRTMSDFIVEVLAFLTV